MRKVKADTSRIGERWAQRLKEDRSIDLNRVGIPAGAGELPYDLPAFIEVSRLMTEIIKRGKRHSTALLGWTIDLTVLRIGKVEIKIDHNPRAMSVSVDGEVVWSSPDIGEEVIWDEDDGVILDDREDDIIWDD